ncbi:hypothetical protein [Aeromicrobium sp. NPDC092404]|uniref:hypothetical protein n=1 Tax=Aeromicrobium sp. NPDC092404 TaxID=3154976 RepID=UPI00342FB2D1
MAASRFRVVPGLVGLCLAVLVTILVVQRAGTERFSGDPDDIAGVKAAVPELVRGDRAIGAFPERPTEVTAEELRSRGSRDRIERAVRAVWVEHHVAREMRAWDDYVDEILEIRRLHGSGSLDLYDDTRLDVTDWLGVRIEGTKAVADVRAYDMYHYHGGRGWVRGQALHHRFTLWRASPISDRWYLADEEHDVDGEYRAMADSAVGAAD